MTSQRVIMTMYKDISLERHVVWYKKEILMIQQTLVKDVIGIGAWISSKVLN
jgi:hypothetical protein